MSPRALLRLLAGRPAAAKATFCELPKPLSLVKELPSYEPTLAGKPLNSFYIIY